MLPTAIALSKGYRKISGGSPTYEEERGNRFSGNGRGNRQGDETLIEFLLLMDVVGQDATPAIRYVLLDGILGW
jgi:hypothetical protein